MVSAEDPELVRRWTAVIAASPNVVKGVLGGIQLKSHRVIAEVHWRTWLIDVVRPLGLRLWCRPAEPMARRNL